MYNLQPLKTRGRQLYIKRARGREGARVSIRISYSIVVDRSEALCIGNRGIII